MSIPSLILVFRLQGTLQLQIVSIARPYCAPRPNLSLQELLDATETNAWISVARKCSLEMITTRRMFFFGWVVVVVIVAVVAVVANEG